MLSLAREFNATPGVGAGATAAAGLAGGGIDAVRHGVRSLSRVLGCERPPQGPPPRFDPFACTTNFGEHLDPATLRRFVFKLRLDYLAPEQAEEAFRAWFALPPPAGVTDLAALTPGDLAVVHRKAWFLWKHGEPEALADMLGAECDAKPDRPRPIGLLLVFKFRFSWNLGSADGARAFSR